MTRSPRPAPRRRVLRTREQPRRAQPAADPASPRLLDAGPRRDDAMAGLAAENALLARELARIQQRASRWRDECVARIDLLDAQLMQARARGIVKDTLLALQRESLDALRKRSAIWLTNEELLRRLSDLRARNRSLEAELAQSRRTVDPPRIDPEAGVAGAERPRAARKVLCVGGRTRQLPQYRELVERDGGRFTHASGGADDDPRRLAALLDDGVDLVILQAGYVCQRACRAVEAHCTRTGTCCVLLDKPCAQAFARSLALAGPDAPP